MEFDEKLFEKCFWHFINYTNIPDDIAVQILKEISEHQLDGSWKVQQVFRHWYVESGIPWKDAKYASAKKDPAKGVATPRQQIKFLVDGICNYYGAERFLKHRLAQVKQRLTEPKVVIMARGHCSLHANDHGKVVDFAEYWAKKPMRRSFECLCWFEFEPIYERLQPHWREQVKKLQLEAEEWHRLKTEDS